MKEIVIEKQWLREKYIEKDMTQKEISDIVGCHQGTISSKLKHYSISKEKLGKTKHTCSYCSKTFKAKPSKNRIYCSRDCKNKAYSEKYSGRNSSRWKGGKVELECIQCGKAFSVKPARQNKAKFCSNKCEGKNSRVENPKVNYGSSWRKMRKLALQRDNHRCQVCGMTQKKHIEKHDRALEIHHLKPVKEFENPDNAHFLRNLMTVCKQDHSEIEGWQLKPSNAV